MTGTIVKKIVYAVFVWSVLMFSPSAEAAAPAGIAGSVQPGFWAVRDGNRVELGDGSEIHEFDILETDQTGYALVTFADQSVLEISSGSNVDIRSAVFTPDRNRFNVGVVQGAARIVTGEIVRRNPRNFKLTTPQSTIGIRGTTLLVEVRQTYEKFTVEAIGEGHAVNYSSKSGRDRWTMTKPGDSVSVRVSAPQAPVAPVAPATPTSPVAPVMPTVTPAAPVTVEIQGEGVVQGERDTQGMDRSGAGDNPRSDPQGTPGDSGGKDANDRDDDHKSSSSRNPADVCCNDNSAPGANAE